PASTGDNLASAFQATPYSAASFGERASAARIAGRKGCGSAAASHAAEGAMPNSLQYANRQQCASRLATTIRRTYRPAFKGLGSETVRGAFQSSRSAAP